MNAENFVYWLQGFFEMTEAQKLTPEQVEMIKEHLHLVFEHKAQQQKLLEPTTTTTTWIGPDYDLDKTLVC